MARKVRWTILSGSHHVRGCVHIIHAFTCSLGATIPVPSRESEPETAATEPEPTATEPEPTAVDPEPEKMEAEPEVAAWLHVLNIRPHKA